MDESTPALQPSRKAALMIRMLKTICLLAAIFLTSPIEGFGLLAAQQTTPSGDPQPSAVGEPLSPGSADPLPVMRPGDLPLKESWLRPNRAEYRVETSPASLAEPWWLYMQVEEWRLEGEPVVMIQWQGVDRNWSTNDMIAVGADFHVRWRMLPNGLMDWTALNFHADGRITGAHIPKDGEAESREGRVDGPTFDIGALPQQFSAMKLAEGMHFRLHAHRGFGAPA